MKTIETQEKEYEKYLKTHKEGVEKAWKLLKLVSTFTLEWTKSATVIAQMETNIKLHDQSKYSAEEYTQYRNWFYPADGEDRNKEAFNLAWENHKKHNLHHWEAMVGMPYNENKICYTIEMICDWMSMANMFNEKVDSYYNKMKDKIQLEEWQRELVIDCYKQIDSYLNRKNMSLQDWFKLK